MTLQLELFEAGPLFASAPAAPLSLFDQAAEERAEEYAVALVEAERELPPEALEAFAEDESDFTLQPAPSEDSDDPLAQRLIAAGFAPNEYLFEINRCLAASEADLVGQWALPSRLFQFPVRTRREGFHSGPRTVALAHPALADHPLVKRVEAALGITLQPDTWDTHGTWHHAVDLACAGMAQELIATSHFTEPHHIAGAVAHALNSRERLTVRDARALLAHVDSADPGPDVLRTVFNAPELVATGDKSKGWAMREAWAYRTPDWEYAKAWAYVVGLERGWITYDRSGFARWSEAGRAWWDGGGDQLI